MRENKIPAEQQVEFAFAVSVMNKIMMDDHPPLLSPIFSFKLSLFHSIKFSIVLGLEK